VPDVGIDDNFIKSVREGGRAGHIGPFPDDQRRVVDRVKEQLARTHAQLIHPSLSNEREAALRRTFAEVRPPTWLA
jgi:uncharacterized membrane protein